MTNPLEEAKQKWLGISSQAESNWYDNRALNVIVIKSAEDYIQLLETTVEYLRDSLEIERGGMDKPPHFHIDI